MLASRQGHRVVTVVRIRPVSISESRLGSQTVITSDFDKIGQLTISDPAIFNTDKKDAVDLRSFERQFNFDYTFGPFSQQADIFDACANPLIAHCLEGYNCCFLAYGQTGSGKTFTTMGSDTGEGGSGVIPRLCSAMVNKMFPVVSSQSAIDCDRTQCEISVSYYEIYNERVRDLLSEYEEGTTCRVREHPDVGAFVEDLTMKSIGSYEEVLRVIQEGNKRRAVAATLMNATSSRSHAVFTVHIQQEMSLQVAAEASAITTAPENNDSNSSADGTRCTIMRRSKICLVDLAGSERASLSGATGDRLVESNNINKSLSTLGDVIKALSQKSAKKDLFVPYRNSVLTWLLKDSLGGNSICTMLATLNPCDNAYQESMSTLRYIERAKLIVNYASINDSSKDPAYIAKLQRQVTQLQEQLAKAHFAIEEELRSQFSEEYANTIARLTSQIKDLSEQTGHGQENICVESDCEGVCGRCGIRKSDFQDELGELQRLTDQKQKIIDEYECKFLAPQSEVPSDENSFKSLVEQYKREKEVIARNQSSWISRYSQMTQDLDKEREKTIRLQSSFDALKYELQRVNFERNQLKSELSSALLEVSDGGDYKNDHTPATAGPSVCGDNLAAIVVFEFQRRINSLEEYLVNSKQSEDLLRAERQDDADKFTELLVAAQKQYEDKCLELVNARTKLLQATTSSPAAHGFQSPNSSNLGSGSTLAGVDIVSPSPTSMTSPDLSQSRITQLLKERDRLRDALGSKMEEIDSLEEELETLKQEVHLTSQGHADALEQLTAAIAQERHDYEHAQLISREQIDSNIARLESEMEDCRVECANYQSQIDKQLLVEESLREEVESLQQQLESHLLDIASQEQMSALEQTIHQREESCLTLQESVAAKTNEISLLQQQLLSLEEEQSSEITRMAQDYNRQAIEITASHAQELELVEIRRARQFNALELDNEQANITIAELQSELLTLKECNNLHQADLVVRDEHIAELTTRIEQIYTLNAEQCHTGEVEILALQCEIKLLDTHVLAAKKDLETNAKQHEVEIAHMTATNSSLQVSVDESLAAIAELRDQVISSETTSRELHSQISALTAALEESSAQHEHVGVTAVQELHEKHSENISFLQQEMSLEYSSRIERLENALADKDDELVALSSEAEQLRGVITAAKARRSLDLESAKWGKELNQQQVQQLQRECEQLRNRIRELEESYHQQQDRVEDAAKQATKTVEHDMSTLRDELDQLKLAHQQQLENVQVELSSAAETTRQQLESAVTALQLVLDRQTISLDTVLLEHQEQVEGFESLQNEKNEAIAALEEALDHQQRTSRADTDRQLQLHEEQLNSLQRQHQDELTEFKRQNDGELARLQSRSDDEVAQLQSKWEEEVAAHQASSLQAQQEEQMAQEQWTVVQQVLSMVDRNMTQLEAALAAQSIMQGDLLVDDTSDDRLAIDNQPQPLLTAGLEVVETENIRQSVKNSCVASLLVEIVDRQTKFLCVLRTLGRSICVLRQRQLRCDSHGQHSSEQPSTCDSPDGKHDNNENNTAMAQVNDENSSLATECAAEHDINSLSQALVLAKMELAQQNSECEELRMQYMKLEKITWNLKLQLASLQAELDDKPTDLIK